MFLARLFDSTLRRSSEVPNQELDREPHQYGSQQDSNESVKPDSAGSTEIHRRDSWLKGLQGNQTLGFLNPLKQLILGSNENRLDNKDEINSTRLYEVWSELEGSRKTKETDANEKQQNEEGNKPKRMEKSEIITAVWSSVGMTLPESDFQILLNTCTTEKQNDESDAEVLYHTAEVLSGIIKHRKLETQKVLDEYLLIKRPEAISAVKEETFQQLREWCKKTARLNDLIEAVGTTSLKSMFLDKWSVSVSDSILRLQVLTATRCYISAFKQCREILENAQHALSRQQDTECLKILNPLPRILRNHALHKNGKWIFQASTRHFLSQKLEFILSVLISNCLRSFHVLLEDIGWGSLNFEKNSHEDLVQKEPFTASVSSLLSCQRLHNQLQFLNSDGVVIPTSNWVSACLASLLLIRFKLYFSYTNSPLCRLDDHRQAFTYFISSLKSHAGFLCSCFPYVSSINVSSFASRNYSQDDSDIDDIVTCFVDLLAIDLGQFVVQRTNLLYSGRYKIAPPEKESKNESTRLPFYIDTSSNETPTEASIDGIVADMIDDLVKCCEEIASISPRSVEYVFVTPLKLGLPSGLNNFPIPAVQLMSPNSSTDSIDWRDNDNDYNSTSFKELFDDIGRRKIRIKAIRDSVKGTQKFPNFKNCIDILCKFDSKRLLKTLVPLLKPSTILQSSILTQTMEPENIEFPFTSNTKSIATTQGHSGRTYKISESLRSLIEITQVCESRISILTHTETSDQQQVDRLGDNPVNSGRLYSESVFKPIWEQLRNGLRDAWNSLEDPESQIVLCCLILDSFQLGFEFLTSGRIFTGASFLEEEANEWCRLKRLTMQSLTELLEESYKREFRCYILSPNPDDFTDHVLKRLLVASRSVSIAASRAELLNKIVEFSIEEVFSHLDLRINVLSLEQREVFAIHCSYIKDLVRHLEYFVLSPEALSQTLRLDDLLQLLTMDTNSLKPILRKLDSLLSELNQPPKTSVTATPFLDVVAESDNLSTRDLLLSSSPVIDALPESPRGNQVLEEIQQLIREELEVSELNSRECFGILRKRREFCFTSGYH